MNRKLRFADRAISDIAGVVAWLTQPGAGSRANRRLQRIFSAIRSLPDHPERHPADQWERREFNVEGHRVRFMVRADEILVLRIFGPGQSRD
ncbi:MAG: type II toxin-antitoxin system RelE/ParE family toxin [Acetobacteraceae bacterium]